MADEVRAWFDKDGWRLEPAELEAALKVHGSSQELIVELLDEGADRRRAQPVPAPSTKPPKRHLAPVPDEPPGHVPPQNLEAEEHVLGACMMGPAAIAACTEILHEDGREFYRESHAVIWRTILALYTDGDPADIITVTAKLEQTSSIDTAGGRVRIHEIAGLVPTSANAGHYARIVKEAATFRGLIRAGGEISRYGWDRSGEAAEAVDRAQQAVYQLGDSSQSQRTEHVGVALKESFKRMSDRAEAGSDVVGLASGFHVIDRLTSGFEPGNLIILAARPSMGKTALAHAIVANVAVRQNQPVAIFTPEMSRMELSQRLISREAHVDMQHLRASRKLNGDEWSRVSTAVQRLDKAPIYVHDQADLTLMAIRSETRRLAMRCALALVVVDYLQLMSGAGENRTQEVSKLSRGLKILARDLNVPIIALSQLSRAVEQRTNKRPILSDLRESGSIEQDADLVAFLYRDDYYNEDSTDQGVAELNIAKHRNGPTEMVKLAFQKRFATYTELSAA